MFFRFWLCKNSIWLAFRIISSPSHPEPPTPGATPPPAGSSKKAWGWVQSHGITKNLLPKICIWNILFDGQKSQTTTWDANCKTLLIMGYLLPYQLVSRISSVNSMLRNPLPKLWISPKNPEKGSFRCIGFRLVWSFFESWNLRVVLTRYCNLPQTFTWNWNYHLSYLHKMIASPNQIRKF